MSKTKTKDPPETLKLNTQFIINGGNTLHTAYLGMIKDLVHRKNEPFPVRWTAGPTSCSAHDAMGTPGVLWLMWTPWPWGLFKSQRCFLRYKPHTRSRPHPSLVHTAPPSWCCNTRQNSRSVILVEKYSKRAKWCLDLNDNELNLVQKILSCLGRNCARYQIMM